MKIISWNMANAWESWRRLLDMDIDLALLQEPCKPPKDVSKRIEADPIIEMDPALSKALKVKGKLRNRTAIVKLSKGIEIADWIEAKPIDASSAGDLVASRPGTIAAARVREPGGKPVIVVSMYAQWVNMNPLAQDKNIFADGSAHQLVSDLSTFITRKDGHRVIAAGDLNILRGYGEKGDPYWAARYNTLFDRLEAMGLSCVGPEYPNGLRADPWPKELPRGSRNVPTFRTNKKQPATANRQLDFVFASAELSESLTVTALNAHDQCKWGPSDHCRIEIKLAREAYRPSVPSLGAS